MLFDGFRISLIKKHAPRIDRALLRDDTFKFRRRQEDVHNFLEERPLIE